jgi:hypothetical protein
MPLCYYYMSEKKIRTTILLEEDLAKHIKHYAIEKGISVSKLIEEKLKEILKKNKA